MKLIGEPKDVWNGAMKNIIWPEGPHLYKKNGYYYIMHADGGTGPDHAVTVCRSRDIWGPYENNFCNPILTHRHLGWAYPIKYVGHADIIETPKGEWYMVMLAVRPLEGYTTMGRETFLAKVTWENDWPVVNPGVGMLTDEVEIDLEEWIPEKDETSYTSDTVVEPEQNKRQNPSSDKAAVVTPPEFLICICSSPEIVVNCSGVRATGPLDVVNISACKGESSKDITKTALNHADTTATCYFPEGSVRHVLEAVLAFATNVGDGVNQYLLQIPSDSHLTCQI